MLCLPLLPAEHIRPTFDMMSGLNTAPHINPLLEYMSNTWINSTVWPVESWSVYGQTVRTNNDVEGWHRRLNRRTGCAPPLYTLIRTIHEEVMKVENMIALVNEQQLQRIQRKASRSIQAKLFAAWEEYSAGTLSTSGLLKRCSTFYRPVVPKRPEEVELNE
ncbi:uncharacterized protein LOC127844398 isoform X1 [Dreissena polymorpha]|uniref:Uncharacterized protein n=2 Tax=Dreissena polymorpha TaxID=45954 RepID=A0A9D4E3T6_DREPO|nr:uncharacterized protein LOC127844398 isoform X1 [Dreissena polymorpha]KAH3771450.1 hypothetical protein DPMN_172769 [Dreissena polymorpha]